MDQTVVPEPRHPQNCTILRIRLMGSYCVIPNRLLAEANPGYDFNDDLRDIDVFVSLQQKWVRA